MSELLPQIIFGWPFMIAALLLSLAGTAMKDHRYLVAGALFFMPPSLYMSGFPNIRWLAYSFPFLILGAALLVRNDRPRFAWLLLLPPIAAVIWLAYLAMEQARNLS
jgi:hypothetical protein